MKLAEPSTGSAQARMYRGNISTKASTWSGVLALGDAVPLTSHGWGSTASSLLSSRRRSQTGVPCRWCRGTRVTDVSSPAMSTRGTERTSWARCHLDFRLTQLTLIACSMPSLVSHDRRAPADANGAHMQARRRWRSIQRQEISLTNLRVC
ncbi:hypothetical protein BC628DRAFT_1349137 [Trametes gibbosa]|nr:hypothetical protein BC628DRAFT_1349137 [Trametes gibbosa]